MRNFAKGGRSSKSFIDEKRWAKVKALKPAPDYVLIQFGHNDNRRMHKGPEPRASPREEDTLT